MLTGIDLALGGFAQSGMVTVWLLVMPIQTIVVYKPRHGINIPPAMITALYVINTLGVAVFMLLAVYYYVWQNQILNQLVLREQEKADTLLLSILPNR